MADTVQAYLDAVPEKRSAHVHALRDAINTNIDPAFTECINYKMIGWVLPHELYPGGYHCDPKLPVPFMNLANQKGHIGVYHSGIYAGTDVYEWFLTEYAKTRWKLNMGKCCIRFTAMSKIPVALIGELAGKITAAEWAKTYASNDPRTT